MKTKSFTLKELEGMYTQQQLEQWIEDSVLAPYLDKSRNIRYVFLKDCYDSNILNRVLDYAHIQRYELTRELSELSKIQELLATTEEEAIKLIEKAMVKGGYKKGFRDGWKSLMDSLVQAGMIEPEYEGNGIINITSRSKKKYLN